jgi:hypothetical protein
MGVQRSRSSSTSLRHLASRPVKPRRWSRRRPPPNSPARRSRTRPRSEGQLLYTSFKDRYGFDDGQLKWFHMHARLDRDHGAMLAHYFRHAAGELGDLAQVREQALAFPPLYQRIWDAFGAWR